MANADHLERLRQGVKDWNAWREKEPSVKPDLSEANLARAKLARADLSGADLSEADLHEAYLNSVNLSRADLIGTNLSGTNLRQATLREANLDGAYLHRASLSGANLRGVNLSEAYLHGADLDGARLDGANLTRANLGRANLSEAILEGANLSRAILEGANLEGAYLKRAILEGANLSRAGLVGADLSGANLTNCFVYGISVWEPKLNDGTEQHNLIITKPGEPEITTDNIEVAQFVYLLLHNQKIRDVIDTITSKVVLILGRFSIPERKAVLDALRDKLRDRNLLPVVFDFPPSPSLDVTETVKVLAGLARFVIADITDATEVRVELHNIVPHFTKLPVQPILLRGYGEFVSLSGHLTNFPWMLPTVKYDSQEQLIAHLDEVIRPAEAKVLELRGPQPG